MVVPMLRSGGSLLRILVLAMALLVADIGAALAQTDSCARLAASLDALERNSDFQNTDANRNQARQLQRDLQRSESAYVRQGCNDDAKAGRKLNAQCRALANTILEGRDQLEKLNKTVDTGEAVSQQREAILQEMARFDCDNGSSARVVRQDRGNFFEQLFGKLSDTFDGEGGTREEEFNPYGNYHTVRTLCVRKSDGFYWPVSYSTLVDYVANDAEQCKTQCPDLDVDLYYYDNPGQEPEQMINQFGEAYTDLPNAFKFRTAFDQSAKCTSPQDVGSVSVAQMGDGTVTTQISLRGETFPMPRRDPRGSTAKIVEAPLLASADPNLVSVPLPRRRPTSLGGAPAPVAISPPASPTDATAERVVEFAGRRVRIVGPETPYAQLVAAGT